MTRLASLAVGLGLLPALSLLGPAQPMPADKVEYDKKGTRSETARAILAQAGLPTLEGRWYYAGPFDAATHDGIGTKFPPEKGVDLKATYVGKFGEKIGWKQIPNFQPGRVYDFLTLFPPPQDDVVVYLYHEFEVKEAMTMPLSLGSDDTLTVFFNGEKVLDEDHQRGVAPDQSRAELKLKPGTNRLLIKIGQYSGGWAGYVSPELPDVIPAAVRRRLDRDFPPRGEVRQAATSARNEDRYYKVTTIRPPDDCVLEVGGLGFRPDGKLLACTRRGEIWLIHNPGASDPEEVRFTLFASGLHEPLGLHVVDNGTVYVVQRAELTKIIDRDGDGVADEFVTVCDRWGVSGDYHEFAFGPAVDRDGNFFVTLNVGFGGGHQAKAAWRGWCVKVTPDGEMEPWAYGLRSPNGVNFSPDGDLFYADNQGEWVASNKLHHLKRGKFYGHQAPLRWVKDSPFAGLVPERVRSGMWYDGTDPRDPNGPKVFPDLDPPAIWFPYGRMGQSISEPRWDTTGGKFGPFAGQCFVGDQTRSNVMRVALEKVNGVYQGACFPFRSGLQCGVNRLAFGPDGALYAGQTNRGWGSIGGRPYGLQRIDFTGRVPMEIHSVELLNEGFRLRFTKPLDPATARKLDAYAVKSFTYVYFSTYGCPETDPRAEAVTAVSVSSDRRSVSLAVPGLRKGRVYDISLAGVKSADGEEVLHPEAYYTLNELVK